MKNSLPLLTAFLFVAVELNGKPTKSKKRDCSQFQLIRVAKEQIAASDA
jgi:hypothetical protein